jgi:tuftelin-interacting protein 11
MSDSSEASSEEDDFLFPNTDPHADEFAEPRRKRRKTGRDNKESAALGVFGSDSDDEKPGQRWKSRNLRGKRMGFVASTADGQEKQDDDRGGDEDELEEEDENEMQGLQVEDTPGLRSSTGAGLGWTSTPRARSPQTVSQKQDMGTPLGLGFTPSSAQQAYTGTREFTNVEPTTPPVSRPSHFGAASKGGMNKNSFAAKMMAKMGYVAGQGLGSSGQGIINPIETKLRPQGAGLGAVKEKTQQAKDEAKREAARRGEVLEDSSEEERKRKRKAREKQRLGGGSGTSTPTPNARTKYRTVADIEAAAQGLKVPNVLKSLIDATGKETKLLTSTSGLMTPNHEAVDGESTKIAKRAKRDLDAFADAWNAESERKKYTDAQERQLSREIEANNLAIEQSRALAKALDSLHLQHDASLDEQWDGLIQNLEILQVEFGERIEEYGLVEAAIASMEPLFRRKMEEWLPLQTPEILVPTLRRLVPILGISQNHTGDRKSTTFYESMIVTLWLPKVRTALVNDWDVHEAKNAVSLLESWKQILPSFVYEQLLVQTIVPKLINAIRQWKPRSNRKHHSHTAPHKWLFEWLPLLDEDQRDLKNTSGVMGEVRRKFRTAFDHWDIGRGVIEGLAHWRNLLQSDLDNILRNHLLPRLARHIRHKLEINPSEQDLSPLEDVLKWTDFFTPHIMGELLVADFFPKWHDVLHVWLTSDPNYEEVSDWFSWWKAQIPAAIRDLPPAAAEWQKGLEMMALAVDLGERAADELPAPVAPPRAPREPTQSADGHKVVQTAENVISATTAAIEEDMSFKDQVDQWCMSENLLMMPMREAHATTGLPVFRITASATGKGGVLIYLKGDVVWAQSRARDGWYPIGLDHSLVDRAEGKAGHGI